MEHGYRPPGAWVPGCFWWRRPAPDPAREGIPPEVAEFMVLGFDSDGVNVYTVSVEPTMAKVALSCPDTDSGVAWVTRDETPQVFARVHELVRELMDS